ncbi:hypothetical protein MRB53_002071 [Persea americana]|uniref:Uncharacterized protein n=1 Tax=Persea americana TaxID=3435 RepID=A0ACC2MUE3_PERAE|nr:hypothetical protein MRB53_002071 [Persea americana]
MTDSQGKTIDSQGRQGLIRRGGKDWQGRAARLVLQSDWGWVCHRTGAVVPVASGLLFLGCGFSNVTASSGA